MRCQVRTVGVMWRTSHRAPGRGVGATGQIDMCGGVPSHHSREVLMPPRLTLRPARSWLVAACLAVGLFAPSGASAKPSSRACDNRANDTPGKLLPCIKTDDLWNHMEAFQDDRRREPGPGRPPVAQLRRTGLPGVGPVRQAEDGGRRIRRHAPAVQVHLHVLRRDADVERDHRRRAASPWSRTGIPGRATATATDASPAGRWHRHAAERRRLDFDEPAARPPTSTPPR